MVAEKILIVDDEPDVARTLQLLLKHEGFPAGIASGGKEALKKLGACDLVLLDILMPKMSGKQVLEEMRKRRIRKHVIVISASGLTEAMRRELEAIYPGISFVSKAHMTEHLIPAVKKALGKG